MSDFSIKLDHVSKNFEMNEGLSKNKSKRSLLTALNDVSLTVQKGKLLGIIGRNGSGKTTLLRTISGIYAPDFGNVHTEGVIAPLLQLGTGFHNELNALENIMMNGILLGLDKKTIKEKSSNIISFADSGSYCKLKKNVSSKRTKKSLLVAEKFAMNFSHYDFYFSFIIYV